MACNYPIQAYRLKDGSVVFDTKKGYDIINYIKIPCGACIGCRLERARQWALRCVHEASLYERNCFITLTYNKEHLPDANELDYSDFQKFMKRLRKKVCNYLPTTKHHGPYRKIRFFMCGEYGENFRRPHFHACIFNLDFDDRIYHKTSKAGSKIYTSEILQSIWRDKENNNIGYTSVGDITFDSAGYVARYIMKKGNDERDYEYINLETGEVQKQKKEFNRMSLKPGIGNGFYKKFKSDIFPHDICVINGVETKPPKYYYKMLVKEEPELAERISYEREARARKNSADNTEDRLIVKEKVLIAKTKNLRRELV